MSDDLSVALDRLRASTSRLNEMSNRAAQTVRDVEAFLESSNVGVDAAIIVGYEYERDPSATDYDPPEPDSILKLGYCRTPFGKFRIVLIETPRQAQSEEESTVRPWSECSRERKLRSFQKLPELLVELAERVDAALSSAEQKVMAVNAALRLPMKRGEA